MKEKLILQLFAEADPEGGSGEEKGSDKGQQSASIDYDKLAQIIAGKQSATEDSVIKGYLKQQGLSKEEMDSAISAYKNEKAKNDPAKKLADLQAKLDTYEKEKILSKHNVKPEDYDYIKFKAGQNVSDKTSFEQAVKDFIEKNPRFVKGAGSYRVDTGSGASGKHQTTGTNGEINDIIRKAFGRN